MKNFNTKNGPFSERPYYERRVIEKIAIDSLRSVGLLPASPGPIRIDRFLEKRFRVCPVYEDLPAGLLGYAEFGPQGPREVFVSRSLAESDTLPATRLVRSTLAHEGGHMLLHSHLFEAQNRPRPSSFLEKQYDVTESKILCSEESVSTIKGDKQNRRYDGRWWEYQANLMIGALLLPRHLVAQTLESMCSKRGALGLEELPQERREEAAALLSDIFDVNPIVATIRIQEVFPDSDQNQLTL